MCVQASATHTHTHTISYQRLSSRIYVEMIVIVTATYLQNRRYYVEELLKVFTWTTMSLVSLNWSSRLSKQKKLQLNFHLLTVAHIQQSRCGLTIRAMPKIIEQNPLKLTTEYVRRLWRQFRGCSLPVVARALPQTRKQRCSVPEQSFGMCNICIHTIVFELCFGN